MSLKNKLNMMNVITLNASSSELASLFGVSRQIMYDRMNRMLMVDTLVEYCDAMGFTLIAENEYGTKIEITRQDTQEDIEKRRQNTLRYKARKAAREAAEGKDKE